jgi:glyoxylate carboligase
MQGLLIGIANAITGMRSGVSAAATIFAAYKARVIADGGVVENDACTIAFLESIGAAPAPTFLTWGTVTLKNWGAATTQNWG